jgi:hypothetical protein
MLAVCLHISGLHKKSMAPSGDEMLRLPQVRCS